ncbi:MAG: hypothetical protein KME29_04880 [Calothrix sp. FI2-JRJ7]|nr:hypothetical protein [Calothrix sp. FI2-JRJ7]
MPLLKNSEIPKGSIFSGFDLFFYSFRDALLVIIINVNGAKVLHNAPNSKEFLGISPQAPYRLVC